MFISEAFFVGDFGDEPLFFFLQWNTKALFILCYKYINV